MFMQSELYSKSPVAQDFIWMAEYPDGTHLSEFDFATKEENSFYDIDRDRLFRFGLVGHGQKIYFERDGVLNVAGRRIHVAYEVDGKMLPLNGVFKYDINDIITYKDAQASGLTSGFKGQGTFSNRILQYNVGFKTNLNIDGVSFHFKAIVHLPLNEPAYITFWLVADKDLDGKFIIVSNGRDVLETQAPLKQNVGGELKWVVQ
ncbi:hypothetical protein BXO87_02125 [Bacillus sp. GZB]|nr:MULTISPECIES: hypothetical protein [Bacillus]MCZ4246923.1 hypothetical protein [Bacillus amyloliquefaciens]OMQ06824.1 hypothetical protein BXO87_02125 [Bacillus sp. GZB]